MAQPDGMPSNWAGRDSDTVFHNFQDVHFQAGQYHQHGPFYHGPYINNVNFNSLGDAPHAEKQRRQEARRRRYLASLHFSTFGLRGAGVRSALQSTCEWLLQRSEIQEWLHNASGYQQKLLWIKGKPGTGKSTIVKFLIGWVRAVHNDAIILDYFFNARGSHEEKTTSGMFRALLYQLLEAYPELQPVLDTCNAHIDQHGIVDWRVEQLRSLFTQVIGLLGGRRVLIFIDALDECPEDDIRDMLEYFEDEVQDAAQAGYVQLHVCLSSRHYPHVQVHHGEAIILEDQVGHMHDIIKYVNNKLRIGDDPIAAWIREEIPRRCSGIFLWTVLVVRAITKEFDHGNKLDLKSVLSRIPRNMDDMLRDLLQHNPETQQLFVSCIQWILFARESLRLEQLYFGLLSGKESLPGKIEEVLQDDMERRVLHCSRGLVERVPYSDGRVQVIHESVREFFLRGTDLTEFGFGQPTTFVGRSHDYLKQCCSNYIQALIAFSANGTNSHHQRPRRWMDFKRTRSLSVRSLPFLQHFEFYARRNILWHAEQAQAAGCDQSSFLFDSDIVELSYVDSGRLVILEKFPNILNVLRGSHSQHLLTRTFAQLPYMWPEFDGANGADDLPSITVLDNYSALRWPLDTSFTDETLWSAPWIPRKLELHSEDHVLVNALTFLRGDMNQVRSLLEAVKGKLARVIFGADYTLSDADLGSIASALVHLRYRTRMMQLHVLSLLMPPVDKGMREPSATALVDATSRCGLWGFTKLLIRHPETKIYWGSCDSNTSVLEGLHETPLLWACRAGQWELARDLLMRPDVPEHLFSNESSVELALPAIGNAVTGQGYRDNVLRLLVGRFPPPHDQSRDLRLLRLVLHHHDTRAIEVIATVRNIDYSCLTSYERLQLLIILGRWNDVDYQDFEELDIDQGRRIVSTLVCRTVPSYVLAKMLASLCVGMGEETADTPRRLHFTSVEISTLRYAIEDRKSIAYIGADMRRRPPSFGYLRLARAALFSQNVAVINVIVDRDLLAPSHGEEAMELQIGRALFDPLAHLLRTNDRVTLRAIARCRYIHPEIQSEHTRETLRDVIRTFHRSERILWNQNHRVSARTREAYMDQWKAARQFQVHQLEAAHFDRPEEVVDLPTEIAIAQDHPVFPLRRDQNLVAASFADFEVDDKRGYSF
ncbi:Hypothetical protein D9617_2g057920 [Elsinoe fawcettii]|nr:Hypothetical protein D9617_2g057920 [Elsinoe fawcettii]